MLTTAGYGSHAGLDNMGVTGISPLAMMSMHEQYPWMKEKKSSRKNQMQGRRIIFRTIWSGLVLL